MEYVYLLSTTEIIVHSVICVLESCRRNFISNKRNLFFHLILIAVSPSMRLTITVGACDEIKSLTSQRTNGRGKEKG